VASARILKTAAVVGSFIACVAVISYSAWMLVPHWLVYRERAEIEPELKRLQIGAKRDFDWSALFPAIPHQEINTDVDDDRVLRCEPGYTKYNFYCIVTDLDRVQPDPMRHFMYKRIRVFRLPLPPESYEARTQRGRDAAVSAKRFAKAFPEKAREPFHPSRAAYAADFLESLVGRAPAGAKFDFEFIHIHAPKYDE
jgi:hypothetical protein